MFSQRLCMILLGRKKLMKALFPSQNNFKTTYPGGIAQKRKKKKKIPGPVQRKQNGTIRKAQE